MLGIQRSGSAASGAAVNAPTTTGGKGDAFGDLFAGTTTVGGGVNGTKNMTLAARLALEKQQAQQLSGAKKSNGGTGGGVKGGNNEVWLGLDSLGGLGGVVGNGNGASSHKADDDEDDWGLSDFGSGGRNTSSRVGGGNATVQPSQPQPARAKSTTLWDLDDFASSSSTAPSLAPPAPTSTSHSSSSLSNNKGKTKPKYQEPEHVDSPDEDFDFGGREDRVDDIRRGGGGGGGGSSSRNQKRSQGEKGLLDLDDLGDREARDGLLGDDDDDFAVLGGGGGGRGNSEASSHQQEEDDDILGMLSKPVEVVRASTREKVCIFFSCSIFEGN